MHVFFKMSLLEQEILLTTFHIKRLYTWSDIHVTAFLHENPSTSAKLDPILLPWETWKAMSRMKQRWFNNVHLSSFVKLLPRLITFRNTPLRSVKLFPVSVWVRVQRWPTQLDLFFYPHYGLISPRCTCAFMCACLWMCKYAAHACCT